MRSQSSIRIRNIKPRKRSKLPPKAAQPKVKESDIYNVENLITKAKLLEDEIKDKEKRTAFELHYKNTLIFMKGRIKQEVTFNKNRINGNKNKMENALSEEVQNIEMLSHDMKRIMFLKATRDGLTKMIASDFVTENMRESTRNKQSQSSK